MSSKLFHVNSVVLLLLCAGSGLHAQVRPPAQPFRVAIDYSRFRGDSGNLFVEVYYSIPQRSLIYNPDTAGLRAEVDLTLLLLKRDTVERADRWLVPHVIRDTSKGAAGMNLVGLYGMMVGEGHYILKLTAHDNNDSTRRDSTSLPLTIRMIDTTRLVVSDIELASNIRKGVKGSQFYKNTLEVVPNVESVFGEHQKCWLYAEVYNVLATHDRSDYRVKTSVVDAVGKEVIAREKPRKRSGESSVLVDDIDVKHLKSGTYTLLLELADSTGKIVSRSGKKFFVFNKTLGIDSSLIGADARVAQTDFARMDEKELDAEFRGARHLSTDEERSQFENLKGADAKRSFLLNFWLRRPPGSRAVTLERIAYSNKNFRTLQREGCATDRGRVYIVYGPPDDVERHPSEAEMRPYEIWNYNNIQSGVIFVFVQRQISGEFELVHSTHRNELHDENWQRFAVTR